MRKDNVRVLLISPYPDITSFGLRTLSSYLRSNGVWTRLVFLPDPLGDDLVQGVERYSHVVLDELQRMALDVDLIGIGLMTNYFDNARQITAYLKQHVAAPIIWGGVHPTIRPLECLQFADWVCVGDGEEALLEVARKLHANERLDDIPNIWGEGETGIFQNPPRALTRDLDSFPFPDYSCKDHYILYQGHIRPLDMELIRRFLSHGTVSRHLGRIGYQTMTGRGCPHKCSYCINDAIKTLYGASGYLRWRSVGHVIAELKQAISQFPFIDFIWISDDAFLSRSLKSIQYFCDAYKKEIGLPFSCLASPLTVDAEKMEALVNAGLKYIQMGVQTGSSRMQAVFNRKSMNNAVMLSAMEIIHRYRDRMDPPSYDFILDVPYESLQDKIDSLRLIARIPKPFRLQPFALVLYPGTLLYEKAKTDGLIQNEIQDIYAKSYTMQSPTYTNLLVLAARNGRFPSRLLEILSTEPLVDFMENHFPRYAVKLLFIALKRVKKILRKLKGSS
ncbi:B12-binding domain-containing radical SAM protein [Desulfatirhabdium butyrativorans]|uniref:B12-binding domain-containing radical SAM protein n=1 Tax=Desulfatirhabdium butyrativorans TaxID=340467 RepID=UPI000418B07B|nr:radical SAM protein [Desulfatirhabdium butyrativorans]